MQLPLKEKFFAFFGQILMLGFFTNDIHEFDFIFNSIYTNDSIVFISNIIRKIFSNNLIFSIFTNILNKKVFYFIPFFFLLQRFLFNILEDSVFCFLILRTIMRRFWLKRERLSIFCLPYFILHHLFFGILLIFSFELLETILSWVYFLAPEYAILLTPFSLVCILLSYAILIKGIIFAFNGNFLENIPIFSKAILILLGPSPDPRTVKEKKINKNYYQIQKVAPDVKSMIVV